MCCCVDVEQVAEETRKQRQAKRKRSAAAGLKDDAARLAELREDVEKQERRLQRAKNVQKRREMAAKYGLPLPGESPPKRDPIPSRSPYDEGDATSILVKTLGVSHACVYVALAGVDVSQVSAVAPTCHTIRLAITNLQSSIIRLFCMLRVCGLE